MDRPILKKARSELRKKTVTIGVRATPEEKVQLKARAAAFGISLGKLCRSAIFDSVPKSKIDQSSIADLAAARADLGRMGGLLKGWLAGSFKQVAPTLQTLADVEILLREIKEGQKKVVEAVHKLTGNAP